MPHFDRSVYEPGDEVRVFDGSEDDEDVEGSRLPLLIVLALLVLAMFGGVVWLAYTQGVARGRSETPVLTAQNGPARIAPANPGGAEQPYKGFKIYEQPAPPDDDADAGASSTPVKAAPAQMQASTTPAAAPPKAAPIAVAPAPKAIAVAPAPKAVAVAVAPAPKPVAVAAAPKPAPVVTVPKPAPVAAAPLAVALAPKPAPATVKTVPTPPPAATVATGPATAAPRSLALVPSKPAPVAAATSPAATGGAVLQIGAYKSQADADAAWKAYKAKHAALLSGSADDVQQADLGDKGIWYRLRITGFPSKDVASAMCDRLKADGGVCLLGK